MGDGIWLLLLAWFLPQGGAYIWHRIRVARRTVRFVLYRMAHIVYPYEVVMLAARSIGDL